MIEVRAINLPVTNEDVRTLRIGELVSLSGEIVITAGLPTHERIREAIAGERDLPYPLAGGTLFHLGSYSEDHDGALDIRYMNPTTSTRFNPYMADFIRALDLRMVGGKGGLNEQAALAMRETGCVYLSFLGGGCPLLSAAMVNVVQVGWSDLIPHYRLVKLKVRDLGPLTVAIDAHGHSLYSELKTSAAARLPEILAELDRERESSQ